MSVSESSPYRGDHITLPRLYCSLLYIYSIGLGVGGREIPVKLATRIVPEWV